MRTQDQTLEGGLLNFAVGSVSYKSIDLHITHSLTVDFLNTVFYILILEAQINRAGDRETLNAVRKPVRQSLFLLRWFSK